MKLFQLVKFVFRLLILRINTHPHTNFNTYMKKKSPKTFRTIAICFLLFHSMIVLFEDFCFLLQTSHSCGMLWVSLYNILKRCLHNEIAIFGYLCKNRITKEKLSHIINVKWKCMKRNLNNIEKWDKTIERYKILFKSMTKLLLVTLGNAGDILSNG